MDTSCSVVMCSGLARYLIGVDFGRGIGVEAAARAKVGYSVEDMALELSGSDIGMPALVDTACANEEVPKADAKVVELVGSTIIAEGML